MHIPITPKTIQEIQRGSKNYPLRLNDLADPPSCLYIYGNIHLLSAPMVAIVGSRKASMEGLKVSRLFARTLSKAGLLVVSGLARGIDGAAHTGAMSLGTDYQTAAVCGTGLDMAYPKEHAALANAIGNQGLLISEYPAGTGPKPYHFPRRNRIIAALSLGVVVIEAAERSGSLITARLAAELGREVFALPGPIYNPLFGGCHQLIQQGAKLARNPDDVLEELIIPKNPF
ncbi:DNA-processing protein DprA [Polynucleobacter asymbioticus]|uniref:DNA protecting protein DprA n=1 Tax=Polynucleobacter asymbioticus (strain DSM 18221 / CIP 109841 / QLW-P1DMWA-1) TaxID=312153 RepID=A4T0M7_POLAQ|nr:DNA-processing protein DprA [Polynucleobacter asymbioticus]ABP35291.1 DNA protecting protein DprA [Polynucleobacter asymbioticus QLW-P1DMWA-1]APC07034.1 DNA processing protein DprA [Polynucleobacter asymbioticus]